MASNDEITNECSKRLELNEEPIVIDFFQIIKLFEKKSEPENFSKDIGLTEYLSFYKEKKTPIYVSKQTEKTIEETLCKYFPIKKSNTKLDKKFTFFNQLPSNIDTTMHKPFPIFLRNIELGVIIRYEQSWQPKGYKQGELINSFSIAPGEELNLEVFSWDRKKIEQERINESSSENTTSGKITNHAALDVVTSAEFRMKVGAGGQLDLKEMEIPGSIRGNFETELKGALQITQNEVHDATRSVSNTLRTKRKLKITESKEYGYESRNTRKMKNENRCHTLNYNYYQILEEFSVSMEADEAQYVALVPLAQLIYPFADVSWILCHEGVLRKFLLDDTFLKGFDALLMLEKEKRFENIFSSALTSSVSSATISNSDNDTLKNTLQIYFNAVVSSADSLKSFTATYQDYIQAANFLDEGTSHYAYNKISKSATKDFILSLYPDIFSRIDEVKNFINEDNSSGKDIAERLYIFKSQVINSGLMNFAARPLKVEALPLMVFRYDDIGLMGALKALFKKLDNLNVALDTEIAADATLPSASEANQNANENSDREHKMTLADYQVESDRLICHIMDHKDYYRDVIFAHAGNKALNDLLASAPQLDGKVEKRLITVQNGYAVLPLIQEIQNQS